MKYFICAPELTPKIQNIIKEFKLQGIEFNFLKPSLSAISKLKKGDIIFWRGGIPNILTLNEFLLKIEKKGIVILNKSFFINPHIRYKFYQQELVSQYVHENSLFKTIPTYRVKENQTAEEFIQEHDLKFPLIQKPDLGSKGKNVELCKNQSSIDLVGNNIFQGFIPNNGDYRIICIGGKVIDIIKRVAPKDSHKNNLSTGGTASTEIEPETRKKLIQSANLITSIFDLNLLGIDILESESKELYFLEINTLFQWDGFEKVTGKNIVKIIADFIKSFTKRNQVDNYKLVEDNYFNNFQFLYDKSFHYLSRIYLNNKEKKHLELLQNFKLNKDTFIDKAKSILQNPKSNHGVNYSNLRKPYFEKNPSLRSFTLVMFEYLFQKEIFGQDFKEEVLHLIDSNDLIEIKDKLLADKRGVAVLGTYALNFLFNFEHLSKNTKFEYTVDLNQLWEIQETSFKEKALGNQIGMQIYYFTHVIINFSYFYTHNIKNKKDNLIPFLSKSEELISENYFNVSLDHKLEFLVCCNLLGYKSRLQDIIKSESEKSLSKIGNYLVDCMKEDAFKSLKNSFMSSEHRNVLYLMAFAN